MLSKTKLLFRPIELKLLLNDPLELAVESSLPHQTSVLSGAAVAEALLAEEKLLRAIFGAHRGEEQEAEAGAANADVAVTQEHGTVASVVFKQAYRAEPMELVSLVNEA